MAKLKRDELTKATTARSVGMIGSIMAMILSFTAWHSVLWTIIAGIFGWLYVIYYVLVYSSL